ncbi:polysaccharide biosynthesis/export family protein [Sphingobacterium faecium]|uniref:polysaccharide biosynthesis/export family protein n=1 Tax=Sphingobacterium faecium TaxID=34087 RepID=UPI00247A3E24|nr:polysaccharide biosynthesis/export family protein [Sphingobacterium faecium]WGQ12756.1 polysaccharide biosynthesis/export family protein [Sphingobacterium faecium]
MNKIVQRFFYFLTLIVFLSILSSCGSRKSIVYLQPDSTAINTIYEQFIPKIQSSDILAISISAADIKATLPFNQQNAYQLNGATGNDFAFKPTYTVDENGMIDFPVLGKIKLSGLTRIEAVEEIRQRLKKYILDPGVNISFSNFKVTVLGEVTRPGTYPLQNERVTLLEALGLAGDLTIKGKRDNILLIREINGKKTMNRIDLTKQDALNSPFYYLAQNDVIYVEPNGSQVRNSNLGQNTNVWISVSSLIITIIAVILSSRN